MLTFLAFARFRLHLPLLEVRRQVLAKDEEVHQLLARHLRDDHLNYLEKVVLIEVGPRRSTSSLTT